MRDPVCFVYPTERQVDILAGLVARSGDTVLVHPDIPYGERLAHAGYVVAGHESGAALPPRLVCLNELAVYFASGRRDHDPGFGAECFDLITKLSASAVLGREGIPAPDRRPLSGLPATLPAEPPFVVKPDFGFASQLVRVIRDDDAWTAYREQARDPAAWPMRARYAEELFGAAAEQRLGRFLVEPYLEGWRFMSMPFAVTPLGVTTYPVEGLGSTRSAVTDFAWSRFAAPPDLDDEARAVLDEVARDLARGLRLSGGLFEVELLLDPDTCEARVLEFSPRPTGGLVPDLLEAAVGVDIDRLAIALAVGESPSTAPRRACRVVGQRRPAEGAEDTAAPEVLLRRRRSSAGRVMIDEILALDDPPVRS